MVGALGGDITENAVTDSLGRGDDIALGGNILKVLPVREGEVVELEMEGVLEVPLAGFARYNVLRLLRQISVPDRLGVNSKFGVRRHSGGASEADKLEGVQALTGVHQLGHKLRHLRNHTWNR